MNLLSHFVSIFFIQRIERLSHTLKARSCALHVTALVIKLLNFFNGETRLSSYISDGLIDDMQAIRQRVLWRRYGTTKCSRIS